MRLRLAASPCTETQHRKGGLHKLYTWKAVNFLRALVNFPPIVRSVDRLGLEGDCILIVMSYASEITTL